MLEIAGGIILAVLVISFWPVVLLLLVAALGIAAIVAAVAAIIAYPQWGIAAVLFIGVLALTAYLEKT